MNQQIAEKTDLFLSGLQSRYEEGKEFWISMSAEFTSGNKTYSIHFEREDDLFSYHFMGNSYQTDFSGFREFLKKQIPQFDTLIFLYRERGKQIQIRADHKNVVSETKDDQTAPGRSAVSVMSDREYYIKPEKAEALLKTIGILGGNGKVKNDKIRKYNQIDHFIELADPILRKLCEHKKAIQIIDCGCGKSYLSFALNYYIKEVLGKNCYFTGLDYNEGVIRESRRMAEELHYSNMKFVQTDIGLYEPDCRYDMLLTLHACDTATDKALNFAIHNKIPAIICVPCCHKELNAQYHLDGLEEIFRYGILKARIADSLTDGLRALYLEGQGYDVSMLEYISPIDTPKNLMLRALRVSGRNEKLIGRFEQICKLLGADLSIGK